MVGFWNKSKLIIKNWAVEVRMLGWKCPKKFHKYLRAVVQSLSHVRFFVTPWTAAHQASLSFTKSQSSNGWCKYSWLLNIPLDVRLPFPKSLQTGLAALLFWQAIFLLGQVHTNLFAYSLTILGNTGLVLTSLFNRQPSWLNK